MLRVPCGSGVVSKNAQRDGSFALDSSLASSPLCIHNPGESFRHLEDSHSQSSGPGSFHGVAHSAPTCFQLPPPLPTPRPAIPSSRPPEMNIGQSAFSFTGRFLEETSRPVDESSSLPNMDFINFFERVSLNGTASPRDVPNNAATLFTKERVWKDDAPIRSRQSGFTIMDALKNSSVDEPLFEYDVSRDDGLLFNISLNDC